MDFFGHQDRARRSSGRLVILFSVAVAAVAGSIALLAGLLLGRESGGGLDAGAFLGAGAATLAVIGIGALLKTASLAAGGRRVAEALGGRLVQAGAASPAERRLLNVVEEMALAAGVPVPLVFVLDAEPGINAFAAGRTPEDAAVAVTRGALETFSRDELQGVIAHEFSHILNGDMRLNLRLMGLLGGILALTVIGRILLRAGSVSTGRRKKDGAGLALVGLGLVVIGWVGVLAGRMIQAAVSRQREYLADASAVQFTRNPDGIGGALRKIRDVVTGSRVAAPAAAEASHMFFGPVSAAFLFATHPPLDERIARVEGLPLEELRAAAPPPPSAVSRGEALAAGFAAAAARAAGADLPPGSMESAARIAGRLPGPLRDALGNGLGAAATVSALLLDRDPAVRTRQEEALAGAGIPGLAGEVRRLAGAVAALPPALRLPVADLALPALRQLSPGQAGQLLGCLESLAVADRRITLFELCLQVQLRRRLRGTAAAAARPRPGRGEVRAHAAVLLSALARSGSPDPEVAARAFAVAARRLTGLLAPTDLRELGDEPATLLGPALEGLARAPLATRRAVLESASILVLSDRTVALEEAELVRAAAAALDLPLPGFADVA